MLTSKKVKEYAKKCGADIAGIASMDRFEGAPKQMDPRYIFPDAKAMIVMGFRIPRGCFRGIEEGTYFANYCSFGYYHINLVRAMDTLRDVTIFLEDEGYEAVPYDNTSVRLGCDAGRAVSPEKPRPDVFVHFRIAAFAAGLGEIGYSKVFLTPEFGPRQRFALILTDAPLEPDPLFKGGLCDRCMQCAKECSGNAISRTKTVKIKVAGKTCEWGELDEVKCAGAYEGGITETNPFLPENLREEINRLLKEAPKDDWQAQAAYSSKVWNFIRDKVPYNRAVWESYHHPAPIEGARGCMRACMIHLEEQGKLKNKFKEPFRRGKAWKL